MLDKAGRDRTQIGARSTAGDPDTRVVDKGPTTMAILNAGGAGQRGRLGAGASVGLR